MTDPNYSLLEAFVFDSKVKDLEDLTAEYNLFEALNIVHQELRHSDFLGFLFNPSGKHGLGDTILKKFLIEVLRTSAIETVTALQIDLLDLSQVIVERESDHIDLLIYDREKNFVCSIENKIFSAEHSNQLNRYVQSLKMSFPDATPLLLFLTPDGIATQEEESGYTSVSYNLVAQVIEDVLNSQRASLGQDIAMTMHHYVQMLRRYIVTDSEIAKLCLDIYRRHKTAIDLIVEHIPDDRQKIVDHLVKKVDETTDERLVLEYSAKSAVDFAPDSWKHIEALQGSSGWLRSGQGLAFEVKNFTDYIAIYLILGPLPQEKRERVFRLSQESPLFKKRANSGKQWVSLMRFDIKKNLKAEGLTLDELCEDIDKQWEIFTQKHLKPITAFIVENLA